MKTLVTAISFVGVLAFHSGLAAADPAKVGNSTSADRLVQQALQAELDGDLPQRTELLHRALEEDSSHPPTNWHLGYLQSENGHWLSITQHQELNALNERLLEYRELRTRLAANPRCDLDLAEWCTRNDMKDVAAVHYAHVLESDRYKPSDRREAMRRLGLKVFQGRLMTDEEIKAATQAADEFKDACRKWVPRLKNWQESIEKGSRQGDSLAKELLAADDPHLAQIFELFIGQSGARFGETLVEKLGTIESKIATEALVKFAVLSPWPSVREAAIAQLKLRSLHDYVPMLVAGLVAPMETEWQIIEAPDGSISYQHRYYQEAPEETYTFDTLLINRVNPTNDPRRNFLDRIGQQIDIQRSLAAANQRDRAAALANETAHRNNERVFEVLEQTTRAQVARDPNSWWQWWQDYNDVQVQKQNRHGYQWQERAMTRVLPTPRPRSGGNPECFVAGTPVWTETGLAPIESIRSGDRVLSQDARTGELAFKAVLTTTYRPPVPVVQLTLNRETIRTTLGHPIWVTGEGWRMARYLMPGHQLHALHGGVFLKDVERVGERASAYNLVVADFHSYFVGENGILVHDNVYREPNQTLVPGLLPD